MFMQKLIVARRKILKKIKVKGTGLRAQGTKYVSWVQVYKNMKIIKFAGDERKKLLRNSTLYEVADDESDSVKLIIV